MCTILIHVFLSAVAGLVWCILTTFSCMFVEQVVQKKKHRPVLTGKEIIILKEVLEGNVSLPVVARNGIFMQGVDKLETLIVGFTDVTERQISRLEKVSEKLSFNDEVKILEDDLIRETPFQDILDNGLKIEDEPEIFIQQDLPLHIKKEFLLASPVREIKLPGIGRNILEKKFGCRTIHDVLLVMLANRNRDTLLAIPLLGMESVHTLEIFMIQEGLIKLDGIDGDYISDYWDDQKYRELLKRQKNK